MSRKECPIGATLFHLATFLGCLSLPCAGSGADYVAAARLEHRRMMSAGGVL